ncbi:hypothetical protein [Cryptosporangium sp. NPDC051539]|uniref:hypothetical protein n=1 Tax=Cryptosporangium sp. NPDC051539 TaxID=3363962 RepID=UPI00378A2378
MSAHGVPDRHGLVDPFDDEADPAVDAILRDNALLDALGRGELPATYRADVTARLLTGWRDDVDRGLPPLSVPDSRSPVLLTTADDATEFLARYTDEAATDMLPRVDGYREPGGYHEHRGYHDRNGYHGSHDVDVDGFGEATTPLPLFREPDRIDEAARSAFVAAGYARPSAELRSTDHLRAGDEPTEQFAKPESPVATFDGPGGDGDDTGGTHRNGRRPRRRKYDRVVVAVAATAAILAAGSAGSVAAAATAHPGDTLWPISRVVYADRAKSIVASEEAHASLRKAREAMQRGDTDAARRYVAEAKDKLDHHVRDGSDEADALAADLHETTTSMPGIDPDGTITDSPSTAGTDNPSTNASTRSRWQRHQRGGRNGSQSASPSAAPTPSPAPNPSQSQGQTQQPPPATTDPTPPSEPTDPSGPATESPGTTAPESPDTGQANPDPGQQTGAEAPAAATG